MAWLSPAYPVGAFSYSSGIEWAVEAGDIKDAETLRQWLATMLDAGSGFCDAVFFVHAHQTVTAGPGSTLSGTATTTTTAEFTANISLQGTSPPPTITGLVTGSGPGQTVTSFTQAAKGLSVALANTAQSFRVSDTKVGGPSAVASSG